MEPVEIEQNIEVPKKAPGGWDKSSISSFELAS